MIKDLVETRTNSGLLVNVWSDTRDDDDRPEIQVMVQIGNTIISFFDDEFKEVVKALNQAKKNLTAKKQK